MLQARRRTFAAALLALATPAAAQAPAPRQVTVTSAQIVALDSRLHQFAASLPPRERAEWVYLLRRAAAAPAATGAVPMRVNPVLYTVPSTHIIVQGGSPRVANAAPAGRASVTGGGAVNPIAIGPKHDDPHASPVMPRLRELGATLPGEQRAALDWLLQRASGVPSSSRDIPRQGTPSLAQALGVSAIAIGPKHDDPSQPTPPPDQSWVLLF